MLPRVRKSVLSFLAAIALFSSDAGEVKWLRAGLNTNAPLWGIEGGLQFALPPAGFTPGSGGPRGLIRIGYPTLTNRGYDLINFIAVEPVVAGQKGFSELEKSAHDQKQGKLFWVGDANLPQPGEVRLDPGELKKLAPDVEELAVSVFVEKFENGAQVRLQLSQRSDRPGELKITVHSETGSAPLESCIITATMGNKARARLLFLNDGPVSSLQLYPNYRDEHFAAHRIFPLDRLPRAKNGDVLVTIANDEENPAAIQPFGRPHFWDYRGSRVLQYWRKAAADLSPGLSCAVNARFIYWGSKQEIPGGISFENFELRESFHTGQSFIFGIAQPGQVGTIQH